MWKPGDQLSHRFNPELGPGRVVELTGRHLVVQFPDSGEVLRLAADSEALEPLVLAAGTRARLEATGEVVTVRSAAVAGRVGLADGREVAAEELWPLPPAASPIDRLATGEVDSWEDFANRLAGLRLAELREAGGLGSFLGGRIQLFAHQLYVAESACRSARRSDRCRREIGDSCRQGRR